MQLLNLNTKVLGKNVKYFEEIDSTQSEIWRLYEKNQIQNGMIVIADKQSNAKGTHGRTWYTDEAKNVAFSFFISAECGIKKTEGLTTDIANIIVDILKERYNILLEIKEPNDIVFNGKKIGGILTESKSVGNKLKCFVIGIGINTLQQMFRDEISKIATSIKAEFDIEVNRDEFITEFCNKFEKRLIEKGIILSFREESE